MTRSASRIILSAFSSSALAKKREWQGGQGFTTSCPHGMIPLSHVTGLAGGCSGRLRENAHLLQRIPDPVFGGGVHFPVSMVKAHVAGLGSLPVPGLLCRK